MDNKDSGTQTALAAAVLSVSQDLHHPYHEPLLKCDIFGSPASTHGLEYGSLGFVYCAGANCVGGKGGQKRCELSWLLRVSLHDIKMETMRQKMWNSMLHDMPACC